MKIRKLIIHNWRSIKDLEVTCQDLMVIIGQNNHGKSNILTALLFFFGEISHADLDFNSNSDELFAEVVFGDLDQHDEEQFKKYLTSDKEIRVRKSAIKGGPFRYNGYRQLPKDGFLKVESMNKGEFDQTPLKDYLPGKFSSKKGVQEAQLAYLEKNKDSIDFEYELEQTNFLGAPNVAQGIFGSIFYVPAVRDVSDELGAKGNSMFSKLLNNVINRMSESNEMYINMRESLQVLIKSLNKQPADVGVQTRPEEIEELESALAAELAQWNTKIDIEITPPDIDSVLKVGTNVWVNDGTKTDVNRKGSGLQRALIFALIKSWSKVVDEKLDVSIADLEGQSSTRKASRSIYFIFEEPELYLHPHAQRELFDSLRDLSGTSAQVFLSTHSSSFVSLSHYKSVCIAHKRDETEGTKVSQCTEDLFANIDEKKRINLIYWINPNRSELFFAKKVILTEGPTDMAVIPRLAQDIGVFRHDYTLIDCAGKENMPLYIHLLNKYQIRYAAVYDKDEHPAKTQKQLDSAKDSTKRIEDVLDSTCGNSVVFENDLEEEIGFTSGGNQKPYVALKKITDSAYVLPSSLENKIKEMYS